MNDSSWHSYPSIYALGHKAIADLFADPVLVEEKVDGSQFSFGIFNPTSDADYLVDYHGQQVALRCRSKGAVLNLYAPDSMFRRAVDVVKEQVPLMRVGWTYRAEYLMKTKHNTLAYDRIPHRHLIGFDINTGQESYLSYETKRAEFSNIGLETVPLLFLGMVPDAEAIRMLLDRVSVLGGQKIEGVVVKNYARFTADKKAMLGKFVSEAFKESHAIEWKKSNPSSGDIVENLIARYRTPARWEKGVQHLRDAGRLEGSPRDIALLFREIPEDVLKECEDEIKDLLFKWAWPRLQRGFMAGLPEWYKERLLAEQFAGDSACPQDPQEAVA